MTGKRFLSLITLLVGLAIKLSDCQTEESTTVSEANKEWSTVSPKKFQEGYVLDEPEGNACVKWAFHNTNGSTESEQAIQEFRLKWEIQQPKGFHEKCDESAKISECSYPLRCVNGQCKCTHIWDEKRKLCVLPANWIPPQGNPGCTEDNDCVDLAECFFQAPCHCTPSCEIVYGICLCKSPVPPRGYRDGDCISYKVTKNRPKER